MAIEIKFYTFNKNPNSTKQPFEDGKSFFCNLIEPTSLISPDIALTVETNPAIYNYAYIPEFSRYYFVNDWVYSNGRWIASLNVDVLASFKNFIGEQRQYVVRSSARYDGNIVDTFYPTKSNVAISSVSSPDYGEGADNPFTSNYAEGRFVVGIVNSDSSAIGCVSYYAFTSSQFRAFCNALMGTTAWMYEGIEEISEELTKVIFNPFQYVASCIWLPVKSIGTTGSVNAIPYGWWSMSVPASRISGEPRLASASFNVPKHPQSSRGNYLNRSPFSKYLLSWPCFGQFPLDADIVGNANNVQVQCFIDPVSGRGTLNIFTDGGASLLTTQTQVGVPIQIAQMASDYIGAAGSIATAVSNIASFDIGGVFNSIGNAVASAMPQLSTMGTNGGSGAFLFPPILDCVFYPVVDDDNERRGRPLMQDVVLSTIPGFIMCADSELEAPCTANELNNIKNYLNGGFYYE